MTRLPRLLLPLLAAAVPAAGALPAQEPPAHIPTCATDSLAREFLTRVRFLLGGGNEPRREALHLAPLEPEAARLAIEEPTCLAASFAYARAVGSGRAPAPPFPVVVVQAGEQLVVQPGGLGALEADRWPVVVLDPAFRPLGADPGIR